jgi:hypothetical protein
VRGCCSGLDGCLWTFERVPLAGALVEQLRHQAARTAVVQIEAVAPEQDAMCRRAGIRSQARPARLVR